MPSVIRMLPPSVEEAVAARPARSHICKCKGGALTEIRECLPVGLAAGVGERGDKDHVCSRAPPDAIADSDDVSSVHVDRHSDTARERMTLRTPARPQIVETECDDRDVGAIVASRVLCELEVVS